MISSLRFAQKTDAERSSFQANYASVPAPAVVDAVILRRGWAGRVGGSDEACSRAQRERRIERGRAAMTVRGVGFATAAALLALGPGKTLASVTFNYTGSLQTYTVLTTGSYSFTVDGAQGGSSSSTTGGEGTDLSGTYTLTAGTVLDIVVGG